MNGFLTYDFIESLKNQKDFKPYIIGLDVENRTKGQILCNKFYKISNPNNEKNYINDIIKIYRKEKFNIILPLSDIENYILLKYRKKFIKKNINFKLPFNEFETAKLFFDKKKFLEFCDLNKFPTGGYKIVKNFNEVALNLKKNKTKKYILKPVKGSGTKNVFLLNNKVKKKY